MIIIFASIHLFNKIVNMGWIKMELDLISFTHFRLKGEKGFNITGLTQFHWSSCMHMYISFSSSRRSESYYNHAITNSTGSGAASVELWIYWRHMLYQARECLLIQLPWSAMSDSKPECRRDWYMLHHRIYTSASTWESQPSIQHQPKGSLQHHTEGNWAKLHCHHHLYNWVCISWWKCQ